MSRFAILVLSRAERPGTRRLFSAVEELYPVTFVHRDNPQRKVDAILLLGLAVDGELPGVDTRLPCLAVADHEATPPAAKARSVKFEHADAVPETFRGRALSEASPFDVGGALAERPRDEVIARSAGSPVWLRRSRTAERGPVDLSSTPLPDLRPGQALGHYLSRSEFLGLLPLLDFCKRLCRHDEWSNSQRVACLVFDDVNLGSRTYGCIDFQAMAASARRRGFHASMAMIPFDAGRVAEEAAALFRSCPQELSILPHGNDHVKFELARDHPREYRLQMLAQAIRRMRGLSQTHRLAVCPVEEPPYGIFRFSYVDSLVELGYEAVLCTVPQFLRCNPDFNGASSFGLSSAEALGSGLAVIPRIPFSPGWETDAILASYLGQPVVIAGHQHDAADGLSHVEHVVDVVNGLGQFDWSNPSRIASTRYQWRRDGSTLRVRACGRRITATVPEWAESMIVERPWMAPASSERLCWGSDDRAMHEQVSGAVSSPLAVAGCREITLVSPFANPIDPMTVPAPRTGPWPAIRRVVAETRDRCYPRVPRFLRSRAGRWSPED